jgi:uncharacterized membrane protein
MSMTPAIQRPGSSAARSDSMGSRPPAWAPPNNGHAGRNGLTDKDVERLARALGWLSLGLGLAQIAAPHKVAHMAGISADDDRQNIMRAVGLREIASGIGILARAKPAPWLWARVGGDAMDLALLGSAMTSPRSDKNRVAAATAAVLGITAIDALASTRMTAAPDTQPASQQEPGDVPVASAITVNAPLEEVFAFWNGFQNLPRFMDSLASVEITGAGRTHWIMSGPAGITLEWDAEIIDTTPNERIAWRAVEGSALDIDGEIRFRPAPGEQGAEVIFAARFRPPGGNLGRMIAGLFSDPLGVKVNNDLRRSKQLIELGEIVKSDDSIISGPNPAQPVAQPIGA